VSASVHEERDKGTLPLLFTTQLTAREIVRGKWVARVVHVGSILLGGLPVLALIQLWGGIDMPVIAANFANTAAWLVSVAAFSMMLATRSCTMVRSLVRIYAAMVGGLGVIACGFAPTIGAHHLFLLQPVENAADGYVVMGVLAGLFVTFHVIFMVFFL